MMAKSTEMYVLKGKNKTLWNYFRQTTWCRQQRLEGWYVKDCIEHDLPRNRRCERCTQLTNLAKELSS